MQNTGDYDAVDTFVAKVGSSWYPEVEYGPEFSSHVRNSINSLTETPIQNLL